MRFGLDERVWDLILEVFSREKAVREVLLFGSRAIGRERPASDIDLYLRLDEADPSLLGRLETALDDLLLPWKIDLVPSYQVDDPAFIDHIERYGISVYETAPA